VNGKIAAALRRCLDAGIALVMYGGVNFMKVRVNGGYSLWAEVTSGIPQGSVLGPLLFLIYINDLIDCCEKFSDIYLFADDANIFHHILHPGDKQILQNGVNELVESTQRWLQYFR